MESAVRPRLAAVAYLPIPLTFATAELGFSDQRLPGPPNGAYQTLMQGCELHSRPSTREKIARPPRPPPETRLQRGLGKVEPDLPAILSKNGSGHPLPTDPRPIQMPPSQLEQESRSRTVLRSQ